jgi:hypothetical protein
MTYSLGVVFADRANDCRLWPFVSDNLRKSHLLANLETVELAIGHTVAMKINVAPVSR